MDRWPPSPRRLRFRRTWKTFRNASPIRWPARRWRTSWSAAWQTGCENARTRTCVSCACSCCRRAAARKPMSHGANSKSCNNWSGCGWRGRRWRRCGRGPCPRSSGRSGPCARCWPSWRCPSRSTSSCMGRLAWAKRRWRGWCWRKPRNFPAAPSAKRRRSSRSMDRRYAGTPARPRTRCWDRCTIRSTRARGASLPIWAFPNRSAAWLPGRAALRLGVKVGTDVPRIISDYTIEGRKAVNMLADAYGVGLYRTRGRARNGARRPRTPPRITVSDLYEVVRSGRLAASTPVKASPTPEIGKVFALGVTQYVGSIIEIEATAFPAGKQTRGTIRFNETAGTMAKDSVFNAASVIRQVAGIDVGGYDIHVNVIGGGLIDGPSAGLAVVLAMLSAVQRRPLRQDVAVTGEVSIQGKIKQVGGIPEKIYGARQAGMRKVIIPEENKTDVPTDVRGIEIIVASAVEETLPHVMMRPRRDPRGG